MTAPSGSEASEVSSSPVRSRRSSRRACSAAAMTFRSAGLSGACGGTGVDVGGTLVTEDGAAEDGAAEEERWRRVRGTGVGTGNTVVAWCRPPVAGSRPVGGGVLNRGLRRGDRPHEN